MRIVMAADGTRGDIHPFLALAEALIARGADVLLCAPPDFAGEAAEQGSLSLRWPDGSALCVTATGICLTERKERYWVSTCPTPLSLVEQKRTPDAP